MKLNREIVRILSDPDARQRWTPIGLQPQPTHAGRIRQLIPRRRGDVARLREGEYQAE